MMDAVEDFVVARNPDGDSGLPYLVRLPLGAHGVVLKVRDTWPRTAKVYCHPSQDWDDSVEVVERVPVRSCVRRARRSTWCWTEAGRTGRSSSSPGPVVAR